MSYGIDSYIPALFRALRCRIDSRRHRDGGTEKKGDGEEGRGARRGEARRGGGEPMNDGGREGIGGGKGNRQRGKNGSSEPRKEKENERAGGGG